MMRIAIVTSHPIQYQVPWFRSLAKSVDLEVYFASQPGREEQAVGFGGSFEWDIDLLSGYSHTFLHNVAKRPSANHFFGCDTPEIARIVAKKTFDALVVCGWNLKSYWQAARACRRFGVPVLVRGDSQLSTPRSSAAKLAKTLIYPRLLKQFDGFLAVGERNREYLSCYGVAEDRIYFVPHFVDNEWFAARAAEARTRRPEIRRGWGIPEDAFVPLFVGKFIRKKRPLDLVRAAHLLLTDTFSTDNSGLCPHLLFVGSGELGAELRNASNVVFDVGSSLPINRLQITDNAKPKASFTGFLNQSEIAAAYVAADVLVLPSDGGETWGLVVNEAMACDLPAIVSDAVGCAPDLIRDGATGFSFALGDISALAARLTDTARMLAGGVSFAEDLEKKKAIYSVEAASYNTIAACEAVRCRC